MSLTVLVTVVVAGIALVVIAVHLTGGTSDAKINDHDTALARFAVDFEEETIDEIYITTDAQTAFLLIGSGGLGIVHSIGDKFLTRRLGPEDILQADQSGEKRIELRLGDFTFKGGLFSFDNPGAAAAILARVAKVAPDERETIDGRT